MDDSTQKSGKGRWVLFWAPVLVSLGVIFIGGILATSQDAEAQASARRRLVSSEKRAVEAHNASPGDASDPDKGERLFSLREARPPPAAGFAPDGKSNEAPERGASTSPLNANVGHPTGPDEVDWELEAADADEPEPTLEMVEAARARLRKHGPGLGVFGSKDDRLAKKLRERRASPHAVRPPQFGFGGEPEQ